MLLLSEDEMRGLLKMEEVMEAVEKALAALERGRAELPQRVRVRIRELGDILSMSGYVEDFQLYTSKLISIYPGNPERGLPTVSAALLAFNASTGQPIALMSAGHLTAMRTGAICGVATKYLAREDARILAVIGCGTQARTQVQAVSKARKLEAVRVYCRSRQRAERFAEEMERLTGVPVAAASSAEEAVRAADIISTATTSSEPVLKRQWIKDGAHINAIGSYTPDARELDTETVVDSKIVVDKLEAALEEAGDILIPIREGKLSPDKIYAELGEIIVGRKPGRASENEITLFKTVGIAVQDTAAAYVALRNYLRAFSETKP